MKFNDLKIAGLTRIADCPVNPILTVNFTRHLDILILAFDNGNGYGRRNNTNHLDGKTWYEFFKKVNPFPKTLHVEYVLSDIKAGSGTLSYHYLEELLRKLDVHKPDIVLECESDASFEYDNGFEEDLQGFVDTKCDTMLMKARTMTIDNRPVPQFPVSAHCRGYKWYPNITYYPRGGLCTPHWPFERRKHNFWCKSHLLHFPIYTPEMQKERWDFYGEKKVKNIFKQSKLAGFDV